MRNSSRDALVLTGKSRQDNEEMSLRWKEALEIIGLRFYMGKATLVVSGASGRDPVQLGRYPCGVWQLSRGKLWSLRTVR